MARFSQVSQFGFGAFWRLSWASAAVVTPTMSTATMAGNVERMDASLS